MLWIVLFYRSDRRQAFVSFHSLRLVERVLDKGSVALSFLQLCVLNVIMFHHYYIGLVMYQYFLFIFTLNTYFWWYVNSNISKYIFLFFY